MGHLSYPHEHIVIEEGSLNVAIPRHVRPASILGLLNVFSKEKKYKAKDPYAQIQEVELFWQGELGEETKLSENGEKVRVLKGLSKIVVHYGHAREHPKEQPSMMARIFSALIG